MLRDWQRGEGFRHGNVTGLKDWRGPARGRPDILAFPIRNLRAGMAGIACASRHGHDQQEGERFSRG